MFINVYSLRTTYLTFEAFQIIFPTASLFLTAAMLFHQVIRETEFKFKFTEFKLKTKQTLVVNSLYNLLTGALCDNLTQGHTERSSITFHPAPFSLFSLVNY